MCIDLNIFIYFTQAGSNKQHHFVLFFNSESVLRKVIQSAPFVFSYFLDFQCYHNSILITISTTALPSSFLTPTLPQSNLSILVGGKDLRHHTATV
jgi:hypothetical protein